MASWFIEEVVGSKNVIIVWARTVSQDLSHVACYKFNCMIIF